jgi:hypothetical protein
MLKKQLDHFTTASLQVLISRSAYSLNLSARLINHNKIVFSHNKIVSTDLLLATKTISRPAAILNVLMVYALLRQFYQFLTTKRSNCWQNSVGEKKTGI